MSCSLEAVTSGSVVTRDVPPCTVAAGVPARVIKTRDIKTAERKDVGG